MKIKRTITISTGKFTNALSSSLRLGSGSTWPGHIALKIDSGFVKSILNKNPHLKIVLVAGTNGKTTTAKLIQEVLESNGVKAFRNSAGSNLLNGIASTLIRHSSLNGKIDHDTAIFEVDENTLPLIIHELSHVKFHLSIVLLNLFRDQLDRYGEVNTVAKHWLNSLKKLNAQTVLVVNGDDPMLTHIGIESKLKALYFGLERKLMKEKEVGHDTDFLYCPDCANKLEYSRRSYSHMGTFKCSKCGFKSCETSTFETLPNPMFGLYNKYNINAAALLLEKVFGIKPEVIKKVLEDFSPAFGRQEKINYQGKSIFLLLSKNPTGFNQSIKAILEQHKNPNVLLLLNDRIPDGRDVSWIWDVDFENLKNTRSITVSGDRAYDMALRIKYADINSFKVETSLDKALNIATSETSTSETLYILATYSAMLDARKILKGRSIL